MTKMKCQWYCAGSSACVSSSTCTPEGVFCQDIDCRGASLCFCERVSQMFEVLAKKVVKILCVVSSGRCLDPLVGVVWLLSDLWSGHTCSNPRLHQPPTTKQWFSLQWARERNTGVSDPSVPGFVQTRKEKPHILSNQREFHLLLYQQMTFALGLLGHRAPRRAGRGLYHDTGRVCASREEMRRVPLRSRLRGTAWRRSCATNSPVQVQESSWQHWSQTNSHDRCLCCFSLNSWRLCVSSAFLRSHCN